MTGDRVEVEGAATLAATLRVAASRLGRMGRPSASVAAFLGSRGRMGAPIRTGRLAASVRPESDDTSAGVGSALAYANRTHWGYRRYHQPAQPFLAREVWNNEGHITDIYGAYVNQCLDGVKGTF